MKLTNDTEIKNEKSNKSLCKLFFVMMNISAFTFGGGFVIITFMKKRFVDELHWIDETEMLDMSALAQCSPGAIAVNAAILVGYHIRGVIGAMVAVLGTIIPPMVILSVISFFYAAFSTNVMVGYMLKGMQSGVAAVILDVVCDLGGKVVKEKSILSLVIMIMAFCATFFFDVNVIAIILVALVGVVRVLIHHYKEEKACQF